MFFVGSVTYVVKGIDADIKAICWFNYISINQAFKLQISDQWSKVTHIRLSHKWLFLGLPVLTELNKTEGINRMFRCWLL